MHLSTIDLDNIHTTSLRPARTLFGINWEIDVPVFDERSALVPEIDPDYVFDNCITKSVLAGFLYNRRVLLQGLHGTGKSTHIEQVAARLNWPCLRINLDGHITRFDLLGKDVIHLQNDHPLSHYQEGILPWSIRHPVALVLDEYDAARPEVLFVLQRLLEQGGKLTLLDENKILDPHPFFRLFATVNTLGLGDSTGLYFGTHPLNQGQMDRWNIVARTSYLPFEQEINLICAKTPFFQNPEGRETIKSMVAFADLTRQGFQNGDLMLPMSPRGVLSWAQNSIIFGDVKESLAVSFLNRFEDQDKPLLEEYYQRAFG